MSAEDGAAMQKLQWFKDHKIAFNQLLSQQPQTLAHALADSPVGLLGWNAQLMTRRRDGRQAARRRLHPDQRRAVLADQ